jgi:hypothetical protein
MSNAPSHEEVVQSLIREANHQLVDKINEAHISCQGWAAKLAESALNSINMARETGLYLSELQEQTSTGKWTELFSGRKAGPSPQIHFSHDTAQRYIKLAKALPEPIKTLPEGIRHLTDMLRATGAIPESSGHGEQTSHAERSPFQALVKFAGEMQGCLSCWRKDKPVDEWSDELKSQVKRQLEPLVNFYQSL